MKICHGLYEALNVIFNMNIGFTPTTLKYIDSAKEGRPSFG